MNTKTTLVAFATVLVLLISGCDRSGNVTNNKEAAPAQQQQAATVRQTQPQYAQVLSVVEIKEVVKTPRQVCKDVVVQQPAPAQDKNKILGTVAGAVVGGVLGNQVGGGTGRDLATAAGAVGGALMGRKIQGNHQKKNTQPTVEKQCKTVTDTKEKVVGYDVKYSLNGKVGTVRMSKKPGDRIPVKDGHLVIQ